MLLSVDAQLRSEIRASAGEEDKTEELVLTQDNADAVFYRYDAFNRLVSVEDGENTAGYTYDGNNLRQSKTVNGVTTTHIYDGAEVTADITGDRQSVYVRDLNGILFREENGEKMHYISNPRGDVSAYYYSRTRLLPTYTYDAFGNQTEASGTDPFRYSGEYYDAESGFIYLRNRYYEPSIGRFITEDPYWNVDNMIYGDDNGKVPSISAIMQSCNLYVYCGNNPVLFIDKTGEALTPWDILHLSLEEQKEINALTLLYMQGDKSAHLRAEGIRNQYRGRNEVGTGDGNTVSVSVKKYENQKVATTPRFNDIYKLEIDPEMTELSMQIALGTKSDIKMVQQAAKSVGITDKVLIKEFGDYIEECKRSVGMKPGNHLEWKELVRRAREFFFGE